MVLDGKASSASARRRSLGFLARFGALLVLLYVAVALSAVDAAVIIPLTGAIARVSGGILNALGESVTVEATQIRSPAFAVAIENGCNGLETVLLFCSAVLAFPAPWKRRLAGLLLGFAAIEAFNLVRVVTLFWIGAHHPTLFSASHTILWQSLVVLFGVLLFLIWAASVRGYPGRAPAEDR